MEFCEQCDNLLTLSKSSDSDELQYHCRACRKSYPCPEDFNPCVFKKNYGGSEEVFYEMFVNKYTKYDPTLPHSHNMKCPIDNCAAETERKKEKPDIIHVRYSDTNKSYIYLCCKCDKAWVHSEKYGQVNLLKYY